MSKRRLWLFRCAAVVVGLLPLVLLELVLFAFGVADASDMDDPFVGFQGSAPLFVLDNSGERYSISPPRLEWFRPESFARHKAPNEYRIFCLGGSTVQGNPYAIETSFTTWLELALAAADPSRKWEVVNCGGISYASYRLAPIVQELLEYEPDLFIICTGHNEFLEDRTYAPQRDAPALLVAAHRTFSHLRAYRVARAGYRNLTANNVERPQLSKDVDALLDYRGGLNDYHRDDEWVDGVMNHFRFNLDRMVQIALERNIPVILMQPIANLKDSPPFKFEHKKDLTKADVERFTSLVVQAREQQLLERSVVLIEQALQIDERHAGAWFQLGKCFEALGRAAEARRCFVRAKEEDVCPLRIREPMHATIAEVARDHDIPLVDMRRLLEPYCELDIAGHEVMLDHVHPTIEGHQKIALRLLDQMVAMGILLRRDGWDADRKRRFREQLESLDEVYFARGKMRLEGLRAWSQGRASKIKFRQ